MRAGKVRWVLTGGDSGGPSDGRTGATSIMAAVEQTCTPVSLDNQDSSATSDNAVLYDCQGRADALATAS